MRSWRSGLSPRPSGARGTLDAALTAIPVVGGAKTVYEVVRGRDIIADRPHAT
ncbi:MAG: pre-toxin TG domain-containing protein [Vicinamibacterales bacterium]